MTSEKIFCPNCGTANKEESVFCKNCGNAFDNVHKKNFIQEINDRINLFAILTGILVAIVFLFIGSGIYGILLGNNTIDFFVYLFLVIVTMVFFGSFTIGILGCSDYEDAKSNSITFLLIIINILGMLFGIGFSLIMGFSGVLSNTFPFSSTSPVNSNSSDVLNPILQILVLLFSIIVTGILGCYLGVFLKKYLQIS